MNKRISEEEIPDDRGSRDTYWNNSYKPNLLLLFTKIYKIAKKIIFQEIENIYH